MDQVDDVIQLCIYLISNEDVQDTIRCSLRAGGGAGFMMTVGGIVAGPPGLLVGGVVGGVGTYLWYKDEFKALPKILMELSDQKKQELSDHLRPILGNLQWTDFAHLLTQVSAQPNLKKEILEAVVQFYK